MTTTGKHIGYLSDFIDTAANALSLSPATESLALELEATSIGLGVLSIGMRHLGAAYTDLNPGRDPSCPPPTTFPIPDFNDPPISPLVIDLDGDGLELTTLSGSTVHFDFEASGYSQRTGWVLPDDGFLAFDANSNGKIDNGHELFGNQTTNGFDVLAYYDGRTGGNFYTDNAGGTVDSGNHDGVIDADDPIFSQLRVWQDLNQNGVADSGELKTLAEVGITSIDLGYSAASQDISGNTVQQASTVGLSGSGSHDIADVWFSVDRTNTVAAGSENPADTALPDLHGYGVLKSLHLAMADDRDLAGDVTDFLQHLETMSSSSLLSQFQELLFKWADVEGAPSRGAYIDGRAMAFLEKAHDADFEQLTGYGSGTGEPGPNAGAALTADFTAASETLLVKFLSQVTAYHLQIYDGVTDFQASKFDALFSSLLFDAETDGMMFRGDAFAAAFKTLDMGDAAAVHAASDVIALLPYIQTALNVPPEDFLATLKDAFTDAGATQVIPLLDQTTFEASSAYATTANHAADYTDLPGAYIVVAANASVEADDDHNNIYFIGRDLGVVTIAADAGVDRLLLAEDFDGATKTFALDPDTGDVTIDFTDLGTTLVLSGYFGDEQVFDDFHYQALSNDLLPKGAIGDEIAFHNGSGLNAAGIAAALIPDGASGDDEIVGTPVADFIDGAEGDDTLTGGRGDDTLQGGADDDLMGVDAGVGDTANAGADVYLVQVGGGHDTINDDYFNGHNTLRLEGADPDDVTLTQDGDDLIIGFTGRPGDTIRLNGQISYETVSKIEFDDVTWDAARVRTEVTLRQASAGADTINGLSDSETLAGGHGDDVIIGSANHLGGGDTFLYADGDGDDEITANYYAVTDRLRLTDLTSDDVTVTRVGDDALLSFSSPGGGSVTLHNQFASLGLTVMERVEFADGEVWTASNLTYLTTTRASNPSLLGDASNNSIAGTSSQDAIAGEAGDDTLAGGAGGDDYFFAAGDGHDVIDDQGPPAAEQVDVLHIDADPDEVELSRDGYDVVVTILDTGDSVRLKSFFQIIDQQDQHSDYSVDLIKFANGDVWNGDDIVAAAWLRGTASADSIGGTRGDDIIVGGAGDDTLSGWIGEDTYRLSSGDGDDVVIDQADEGNGGRLVFTDANFSDLKVELSIEDDTQWIKISRLDHTGSVKFINSDGVHDVEFADHSTMTRAQILGAGVFEGTSGPDEIFGAGHDHIHGGQGGDTLWGPDSDTFEWARYDGGDVIHAGGSINDVLALTDITPGFVHLARVPAADDFNGQLYDLQVIVEPLNVGDTAETITVAGQFNVNPNTAAWGIGRITFSDGSQWTTADIAKLAPIVGTSSGEELQGSRFGESLTGGGGDDTLSGAKGDDTYVWTSGDGDDTIIDAPDGAIDTLKLTDVNPDGVELGVDGEDIVLTVTATSEVITFQWQALADGSGIQRIVFGNGVTWSLEDIQAHTSVHGTSGDDNLFGGAGADNLFGEGGADYLDGGEGKDQLVGGAGDDSLSGSDGADTYVYASGDGNDVIQESQYQSNPATQIDTLKLTDLNQSDVTLSVSGVDLLVTITGTGATITVTGQFTYGIFGEDYGQASDGIDRIVFADGDLDRAGIDSAAGFVAVEHVIGGTSGTDTLVGDYGPNQINGLGGADSVDGGGMDDTITGGAGADTLAGGTGNDVFVAVAGDGDDQIDGGDGDDLIDLSAMSSTTTVDLALGTASGTEIGADTLQSVEGVRGGAGDDTFSGSSDANQLYGGDGGDLLQGQGGDDYIEGEGSADTLQGGDGSDELHAGEGDDRLAGGLGDDTLTGDAGSDTYVFNSGDGADQISDYADSDINVLQFGVGISSGDLTFQRPDPGSSTIVLIIGTSGDQVTLTDELEVYGSGVQTITFDGGPTWTKADLRGFIIDQQITSGADDIYGTPAADSINAGAGDDHVFGGNENDTLMGGQGADTLDGGYGDNVLTGGNGADVFDLQFPFGSNTVTDFNATDGDLIRVGPGYTFTALQSHAHQEGSDLVVELDYGNSVTLTGTTLASMQSTWFSFA